MVISTQNQGFYYVTSNFWDFSIWSLFLFVHVPIYSVARGKLHKINHMWSELCRSKDVNLSGEKEVELIFQILKKCNF